MEMTISFTVVDSMDATLLSVMAEVLIGEAINHETLAYDMLAAGIINLLRHAHGALSHLGNQEMSAFLRLAFECDMASVGILKEAERRGLVLPPAPAVGQDTAP